MEAQSSILTGHTRELKLAMDLLYTAGYLWTSALAENSKPLINEGDMICFKKKKDNFKVGDLVVIDSLNFFIVQRIIAVCNNTYKTKADLSAKGPFEFDESKIIAKVVAVNQDEVFVNIDTKLSNSINKAIAYLSAKGSAKFLNKGFFYKPFFKRLRRSAIKRLLKAEYIIGKTDEKRLNTKIQG